MKAVMIGDYLIPPDLMLKACDPLHKAGVEITTLDWGTTTKEEVDERRLNVELHGPEAETGGRDPAGQAGAKCRHLDCAFLSRASLLD